MRFIGARSSLRLCRTAVFSRWLLLAVLFYPANNLLQLPKVYRLRVTVTWLSGAVCFSSALALFFSAAPVCCLTLIHTYNYLSRAIPSPNVFSQLFYNRSCNCYSETFYRPRVFFLHIITLQWVVLMSNYHSWYDTLSLNIHHYIIRL